MDYVIHKLIDLLIKPTNWLLLGALFGVFAGLLLRRVWITWIGAAFLAAMFIFSYVPLGEWLMVPLENHYPLAKRYPDKVDGVVAIGTRISRDMSEKRNEPSIVGDGQPFTALIEFARNFPDAKLILTGIGESTDSWPADLSGHLKEYYTRLGFDPERITYEPLSLTMEDFAENTYELAEPEPGENWYLVASAYRMPRAMNAFQHAGWDIEAWPTDYRTNGEYDPIAPHMRPTYYLFMIDFALNEWLGLITQWWQGKTDTILPEVAATTSETSLSSSP